MRNTQNPNIIIFLRHEIQCLIKRIYPRCQIVDDFQSLNSCSNDDFILIQMDRGSELHKLIWGKIRNEWQKLSPIIVLGYRSENNFLADPENLVFVERFYEYHYLSLPFSLNRFFEALSYMQPIYDKGTLMRHIKQYASIDGLLRTHLHHISNYIYGNELNKCISEFENIRKLLSIGSFRDLINEIDVFIQNPNRLVAEKN